jgi:hypothetical protein
MSRILMIFLAIALMSWHWLHQPLLEGLDAESSEQAGEIRPLQ